MSGTRSNLGRRKRESESSSKSITTSRNTTTTKSTGPYDRHFHQHLVDFKIYSDEYEYPDGRVPPQPENMKELLEILGQQGPSLSLSDEDFRKFKRADAHASKESQVTTSVIPLIQGDVGDSRCVTGHILFANLAHLTDGTLVPGNPDLYSGARPEQLDPRVRSKLKHQIVPSTQADLPILPNFFLEVKGPDGSLAVAKTQACYNGALGARGYRSIQSYAAGEPVFDNKAHVITSTYHGGQLKMYTCHAIRPTEPGQDPEYVMTQIRAYALTSDAATFRMGVAAYRNAMEWAKAERDGVIRQANDKAAVGMASLSRLLTPEASGDDTADLTSQGTIDSANQDSSAPSPFCDSDASADALSMNQPTPKRSKPSLGPREEAATYRQAH